MSFERAIFDDCCGNAAERLSYVREGSRDCHRPQEYQRAAQVAPLKVPAGLDTPNTQGALVIPTVDLAPPPPGPHDACLDTPPRYKPAPPNKAASG